LPEIHSEVTLPATAQEAKPMMDQEHQIENAVLRAQVETAERIARTAISGFALCSESGVPLNDRQKVAFLTGTLLEFDGCEAEAKSKLQVERLFAELAGNGNRPH
jgi:hypothetical protein